LLEGDDYQAQGEDLGKRVTNYNREKRRQPKEAVLECGEQLDDEKKGENNPVFRTPTKK
jgi:hypothetical protein